ncbi:hypothetical protein ABMP63_004306 [Escherichia coli]
MSVVLLPPARPVLTRDMERVLERSGEAPVYWPNLHASFHLREDAGFVPCVRLICSWPWHGYGQILLRNSIGVPDLLKVP